MTDLVPRHPIKISIRSTSGHLPIVRAALERMCELLGYGSDAAGGIVLSVDEALTNIIRHAYDNQDDQPIDVELAPIVNENPIALRVSLQDWGRQVDPAQIKSRSLTEIRPGGLGVHIITKCMDEVKYSPREEGGTLLTMVKNIEPKEVQDKETSS